MYHIFSTGTFYIDSLANVLKSAEWREHTVILYVWFFFRRSTQLISHKTLETRRYKSIRSEIVIFRQVTKYHFIQTVLCYAQWALYSLKYEAIRYVPSDGQVVEVLDLLSIPKGSKDLMRTMLVGQKYCLIFKVICVDRMRNALVGFERHKIISKNTFYLTDYRSNSFLSILTFIWF